MTFPFFFFRFHKGTTYVQLRLQNKHVHTQKEIDTCRNAKALEKEAFFSQLPLTNSKIAVVTFEGAFGRRGNGDDRAKRPMFFWLETSQSHAMNDGTQITGDTGKQWEDLCSAASSMTCMSETKLTCGQRSVRQCLVDYG